MRACCRLSTCTLVTLAIICCVITLLSNVDVDSDGVVVMEAKPISCHFDPPVDEFSLRGTRLERDLVPGTGMCPDVRRPPADSVRTNGRWQTQNSGSDDKFVLYSAFYDDRPAVGATPWIRVLGVAKLANRTHYCHVWYAGCEVPYMTTVVVKVTGRDQGYTINKVCYVQYLLSCQLPGTDPVPTHVSVVSDHCAPSTIYLPIERPVRAEPDIEFGVCVAIAFGHIPAPVFVKWMELTWLLGVREFNVYDAGMVNMSAVFDYYTRRRWLRVHQMPPPVHDLANFKKTNSTSQVFTPRNPICFSKKTHFQIFHDKSKQWSFPAYFWVFLRLCLFW